MCSCPWRLLLTEENVNDAHRAGNRFVLRRLFLHSAQEHRDRNTHAADFSAVLRFCIVQDGQGSSEAIVVKGSGVLVGFRPITIRIGSAVFCSPLCNLDAGRRESISAL